MIYQPKHTRFRAYQLVSKGASFSYWDGRAFILGEARFNNENKASIFHEMKKCGKSEIDILYISSWELDHCNPDELKEILTALKPKQIYHPRVAPDHKAESQVRSKLLIDSHTGPPIPIKITGEGLPIATIWAYDDIFCYQGEYQRSNDNSLIVLFHSGNIGVLSVGDVESKTISDYLATFPILQEQVDVLILSHHGSSPEFNTIEFIKSIKPRVCLALVDRDNQYGHPDPVVYHRANQNSYYFSTKDGDVIIETNNGFANHSTFTVYNYVSNGDKLEGKKSFESKRGTKNREGIWRSL